MEVGQIFTIGGTDYRIATIDDERIGCEYTAGVNPVAFGGDGLKIWNKNHYQYFGRAYVARLTMKVTKVVPDEGCICGECGKFVSINEGCSETFLDGHIEFGCPYCYKTTLYDLPLNEVLE